jgi:siroheme synthase-like protein
MRDESRTRPVLPVNLLVEGQPCLVVGGGPIAARKVGHLLDAAAEVTVVSPSLSDELQSHVSAGRVTHLDRPFDAADVEGKCLVFAATDNSDVNRHVVAACRERNILCSAADENWPSGDFLMPAICRKAGMIVTVSTGGRSCRQARIVKDRVADMLDSLTSPDAGDDAVGDDTRE